jgi:hypothetical protein
MLYEALDLNILTHLWAFVKTTMNLRVLKNIICLLTEMYYLLKKECMHHGVRCVWDSPDPNKSAHNLAQ